MSAFDYLEVLVSIVMGLAMANVLARLAVVVTARERVDFYWPPIAWAIWIFFIGVQHWWAQWSIRYTRQWNFLEFWLVLLTPVALFFLSALILPEREENGKIDLGVWYFRNRAWFFAVLFFLPILSLAEELARTGRIASPLNAAFLLAFDATCIWAFFAKSRRLQEWIAVQTMVLTIVYVVALFVSLPS